MNEPQPEQKSAWKKFLRTLAYKKDALKHTIDKGKVTIVAVAVFLVIAIFLMLQPAPQEAQLQKAGLAHPSVTVQDNVVSITPLAIAASGTSTHVDGGRGHKGSAFESAQVIQRPKDVIGIPPGTVIDAMLITGASNGLIRAQATEDFTLNGEKLVSEGDVFLGLGNSSEERLYIQFSKIVFKNGSNEAVQGQACDFKDRTVGVKGSTVNGKFWRIAGSIGLGFVGGLSMGLQNTNQNHNPTLKDGILNGMGTAALQQSQEMMDDARNQVPIIEIKANTPICIIFGGGQ